MDNDVEKLREISDYFYKTSGIYQRVCNYAATMYRYDWYVVPEVYDEKIKEEKIVGDFKKLSDLEKIQVLNSLKLLTVKIEFPTN